MNRVCLVRLPLRWCPSKLPIAILVAIALFAEPGVGAASSITSRIPIDPAEEHTGDEFGRPVAWVGDVNGDGYDDLLVGAFRYAELASPGQAYLYLGGTAPDSVADLVIPAPAGGTGFGIDVASAGDFNGDSHPDFIIGAQQSGYEGKAFVYYGGPSLDATADFTLTGESIGSLTTFGASVASAGDVNEDGFDDVIVGAPWYGSGGNKPGRAYVFFGGAVPDAVPDRVFSGVGFYEQLGSVVGSAGDMNGDGHPDLFASAPYNDATALNAGAIYVWFGGPAFDATPDLTLLGSGVNEGGSGVDTLEHRYYVGDDLPGGEVLGGGPLGPATCCGAEFDPSALHESGGTMTGAITLDNDSTDVLVVPVPLNAATNYPSIRWGTQGLNAQPWRDFIHTGGVGAHDSVRTFAYNLTYDDILGWQRDSSTNVAIRWGFESRFTTGDPNDAARDPSVIKGLHEWNLDIDPNYTTAFSPVRPWFFAYDMDARSVLLRVGAIEDPNSGFFSVGNSINLWANTGVVRLGNRPVAGSSPSTMTTQDRITLDPGGLHDGNDRAVIIANRSDGDLHLYAGIGPDGVTRRRTFLGYGGRQGTVAVGGADFETGRFIVKGNTDTYQLRVMGPSTQGAELVRVDRYDPNTGVATLVESITKEGLETLLGGTEYMDDDVDLACAAGNYNISADLSETKLKACVNGVRGDIPASLAGSGTLNFSDPAASSCSTDLTIPVAGAASGDVVSLGVPSGSVVPGGQFTAWVSAGGGTVTVRHCCVTAADCNDPASGTFKVRVEKP